MRKLAVLFVGLFICTGIHAQPIKVKGIIHRPVADATPRSNGFSSDQKSSVESITLVEVDLDTEARVTLNKRLQQYSNESLMASSSDNRKVNRVDLGMNGVPVLNQGDHGSCVTFATTAAINALLGKGDYVSQLCSLELGSYLENHSYQPSGWDWSYASIVLNQLNVFGVVSKKYEAEGRCAGVTQYPVDNESDKGSPMSISDYHPLSENLGDFNWSNVADSSVVTYNQFNSAAVLQGVKRALAKGQRCLVGVLLPYEYGLAGATGRYQADRDTWVITQAMLNEAKNMSLELAGHEMVITGFDDVAKVGSDPKITKLNSPGLIKLRNSWGEKVGNKGDFYMSYNFFKSYVREANCVYFDSKKDKVA